MLTTFLSLVRVGLWTVQGEHFVSIDDVDWESVYRLAEEQSVVGLAAAGIETMPSSERPPQTVVLQFISTTLQLEQQNKAMNDFIARLVSLFREKDIYALLVKGQAIAQCYEKPLWRTCGDVDLLLSEDNYKKAKKLLTSIATTVEREEIYKLHQAMTIDSWEVELHGTLRGGWSDRVDNVIDEVQADLFYRGNVRSWQNGTTQVFLPSSDNDVFFVFTHILQHFYIEGVGLRQVCDWCRLLWSYQGNIDVKKLEKRLKDSGIMAEWKSIAAIAVEYLGMEAKSIPLYSSSSKWKRKAKMVMALIFDTGNMGHNRDMSYKGKYPFLVRLAISFCRNTSYAMRRFVIFPMNTMRAWWKMVKLGIKVAGRVVA